MSELLGENKKNKMRTYRKKESESCGFRGTRFYEIWRSMKARCLNENKKDYPKYGGKGITVSYRWLKFKNFKGDMYDSYLKHVKEYGERDTTIDRIDTYGNYTKENCRWATIKEQQQNRTNNRRIAFKGKEYIVSELAREYGLTPGALFNRLNNGWDVEKAILTPIRKKKKQPTTK